MANPQVIVEFIAKVDKLKQGFSEAESSATTTSGKLKTLGKVAVAAAGAAGLAALTYTLKVGIDEFTEASKVTAQTNAVIKSTGDVSHVTAAHIKDLADQLQQKSGVDHDVIQSGENMLLTFRNIRDEAGKGNDIFDQATKATLDLSVAMGKDMSSSAILVGKALNDPVKGVTALTRVGVQFTQQQKDQIKAMVESGNTMGAQKLILQELNKEFGGSAAAAGKTLPGQLSILKDNFKDLAGTMVATLIPPLEAIAKLFADNPDLAKAVMIGILALSAAMVGLNVVLAISAVLTSELTLPILAVIGAVAALVAIAIVLKDNWNNIITWLKNNWVTIAAIIGGPFGLAVAEIIKHWDDIVNAVKGIFNAVYNTVWDIVNGIPKFVGDAFTNIGQTIWGLFNWLFNSAWNAGQSIFNGLIAGVTGVAAAAWNIINNIGSDIWGAFSQIFNWGWQLGAWIIQGVQNGLAGIGSAAWSLIATIGGAIGSAFNTIWGWGKSVGDTIWSGIVSALKGIGGALLNVIKAPINAVISAWNGLKIAAFTINMPGPIPDVHFGGVSLPHIPLLAQGGIVTGPTVAMLGEAGPEMVVPLSGGNAPIQVHVYIGDTELTQLVSGVVVKQNNQTAQTLLAGLA